MAIARGSIEIDRLRRLRRLTGLLDEYEQLGVQGRQRVTAFLQHLASNGGLLDFTFSVDDSGFLKSPEGERHPLALKSAESFPPSDISAEISAQSLDTSKPSRPAIPGSDREPALSTQVEQDTDESSSRDDGDGVFDGIVTQETISDQHVNIEQVTTPSIAEEPQSDLDTSDEDVISVHDDIQAPEERLPYTLEEQFSRSLNLDRRDVIHVTTPSWLPVDEPTEDIPSELASLYLEYRQSRSRVAALSSPTSSSSQPDAVIDPTEARTEYAMSKHQVQLTVDEGTLWDELTYAPSAGEGTTRAAVASLAQKSSIMSQSFNRRTHPPTSQTYIESKTILDAMGVPCLESTGSFEAEALAASLVIHGHADYVASEDTVRFNNILICSDINDKFIPQDVLVYEAPMIRNITNRAGPLVVVSGKDVRTVLQLDRASYVDFALLLGTDFSQRIKNVGPQRALKFIREHGSIERVIERETKYPPREPADTYLEQVELARVVFQTLPPVPDAELLQSKETDEQGVAEILQRFDLHRAAAYDWDYEAALNGNYFEDNPSAY
jgi:flap endonuclease-1